MNDKGENELLDVTTPPEERVILPKKRFGFWGKFVAFLLGFIIGIGSLCGTVFYVAGNVKIKKLTNFVGEFADFDYQTFVGKEYVSEALGDETMLQAIANLGYTAKQKKLAPFCYYFPKLQNYIEGFVTEFENLGIEISTTEFLEIPLTEISSYLKDQVYVAELGKVLASSGELDDLMKEICYPEGGEPLTLGNLNGDIIDNLKLSTLIEEDPQNQMIMYLLYGKEGVEYNYINELKIAVGSNGKVYDATGVEMPEGYTWDSEKEIYTDKDGVKYYLTKKTDEKITVGEEEIPFFLVYQMEAQKVQVAIHNNKVYDCYGDEMTDYTAGNGYYVDKENEEVKYYLAEKSNETVLINEETVDLYYVKSGTSILDDYLFHEPTNVGDLTKENSRLSTITKRMTIGELMNGDENDPNDDVYGNKILKHLADATIETMPDQIKTLTFGQVFKEDIYETYSGDTPITDPNGNEIKKGDFVYYVTVEGTKTTYLAIEEEQYQVKGVWKYMLKDKDTTDDPATPEDERIEKGLKYSLTEDMSKIMDNMTANMKNATLLELDTDGIIDMNDDDLNNKSVPTTKVFGTEEFVFGNLAGKKLGELTVNEMLQVTVIAIGALS